MKFSLLHITTVPMSLTFFRGQVGYMKAQGIQVTALSSPGVDLDEFGAREGIEVCAVPMSRRITPVDDLRAVCRMVQYLRRIRPDIVHAHTPKGGLLGMIAASVWRAKVRIYHIRGLPLMGATGLRRRILWTTEWVACRLAHQVFCVSHSVREEAVRAGICPSNKIAVLCGGSGNGVDSDGRFSPDRLPEGTRSCTREAYGIPENAVVVGFVGRIVRDKGIMELVEAWRVLRDYHPDLHLLLVGPLEEQDPIPAEAANLLHNDPRIHLTGMTWETPPLFAAMDIVVLPTYREGFPNVPLEAAAMGIPVVATRIPGCVDAIDDGRTGMLVPVKDGSALGDALTIYIKDADLRRAHGEAARERVRRDFRQEALWSTLYAEYLRLLVLRGVIGTSDATRVEITSKNSALEPTR